MAAAMKPEDVPAELIDVAMRGAKPGCRSDAAFYLTNVLPEWERMVREQVAKEARQLADERETALGADVDTWLLRQFADQITKENP